MRKGNLFSEFLLGAGTVWLATTIIFLLMANPIISSPLDWLLNSFLGLPIIGGLSFLLVRWIFIKTGFIIF